MPVDRSVGQDLAATLATLYADVQQRLAVDIGRQLRAGLDSPGWAQAKLAGVATLRRHVETVLAGLSTRARDEIEQALVLAYVRGGRAALDEMGRLQLTEQERLALGNRVDAMRRLADLAERRKTAIGAAIAEARAALPGIDAVQRLAWSLASQTQGTHLRILRWSIDSYRQVVAEASASTLLGTATRRRTAQVAWERLLSQGVTGFVDRSGRRWELASYVEMATRSTVAQAAVQSHLDQLGAAGLDLVIVSDSPQECKRCRPWERRVLARSGPAGERTVETTNRMTGKPMRVQVAGTVQEAVAAGLMHPNCTHSLSAYLPGATKPDLGRPTENPQGYADRQRLRELERKVRKAKTQAAAALDPAAKRAANARVRDLQAQIRQHVDATGLLRQSNREQIGVAR